MVVSLLIATAVVVLAVVGLMSGGVVPDAAGEGGGHGHGGHGGHGHGGHGGHGH